MGTGSEMEAKLARRARLQLIFMLRKPQRCGPPRPLVRESAGDRARIAAPRGIG